MWHKPNTHTGSGTLTVSSRKLAALATYPRPRSQTNPLSHLLLLLLLLLPVNVTPNPPVKGKSVEIDVIGSLAAAETGASLHYTISFIGKYPASSSLLVAMVFDCTAC